MIVAYQYFTLATILLCFIGCATPNAQTLNLHELKYIPAKTIPQCSYMDKVEIDTPLLSKELYTLNRQIAIIQYSNYPIMFKNAQWTQNPASMIQTAIQDSLHACLHTTPKNPQYRLLSIVPEMGIIHHTDKKEQKAIFAMDFILYDIQKQSTISRYSAFEEWELKNLEQEKAIYALNKTLNIIIQRMIQYYDNLIQKQESA
ncbi:hypothetical protein CCZ01_01175 [Helicobacter monodelphidis]|uniref:hypothetical protein n=1 Tax=Helicobacter sp. 15-1451 TaxID=2004995 RepID=UPI000DCC5746|nr:hypothetical protein [Helicobacter sp. 15-1451]RAX58836.1 hypothetical protein CCZ01_01175 [Helicobacter sp. 15-1451]